jgi:glycerol uptake facilitator-like aquaporin
MFDLVILQASTTDRTGVSQWFSEILATLGLLFVIFGGLKSRPEAVPTLVAIYITGAYWFTSSTSFANPAVTIARGFSNTFSGVNPVHIPMFIAMQIVGVGIAAAVLPKFFPKD